MTEKEMIEAEKNMRIISVRLPENDIKFLEKYGKNKGLKRSSVIRVAVKKLKEGK